MRNKKNIVIMAISAVILISIIIIIGISTRSIKEKIPSENSNKDNILKPVDMNNLENAKVENGEKINISESIVSDKEINGLKITNTVLKTEQETSLFTADIVNKSGKDFSGGMLVLEFTDNNGRIFATLNASIDPIKASETGKISAKTTADIIYSKDYSIELISNE